MIYKKTSKHNTSLFVYHILFKNSKIYQKLTSSKELYTRTFFAIIIKIT